MKLSLGLGLGLSISRGAGAGAGGEVAILGLRSGATPNGRTSTAPLKVIGVDALPFGMSISERRVVVTTPQTIIENWDFTGYTLDVRAKVRAVTQCVFGDGDRTDLFFYINGNSAGGIRDLSFCTFTGRGDHLAAGAAINCKTNGTGLDVTAFEIDLMQRLRFVDTGYDAIKAAGSTHWNGQRIEWCYFGPPKNLPNTPVDWNNSTTYALGFCVTDPVSGWFYVSKVADNVGNALPPGPSKVAENDFWQGIDPHADILTTVASINRTSVRNCLLDWTDTLPGQPVIGNQGGVNNSLRLVRNTGTDLVLDDVLLENLICMHGPSNPSFPVHVLDNGLGNWNGPVIFRNVSLMPNFGGAFYHPDTNGEVDFWINTTGAAPTGANTVDAAAAPAWATAPGLTGTASGATLTATVGSATGFPKPFYDLSIQRSADGVGGWADVVTDAATYTLQAGDVGQFFRARALAHNSSGEVVNTSSVIGPVAAGYTLNRVATNSTGALSIDPGGTATAVTFSARVNLLSLTVPNPVRILRASNSVDIFAGNTGQISFAVWNSAFTQIYNASSAAGVITAGVEAHIFASYDGASGTPVLRVNGVAITMTPTVGPLTGALRPNRSHEILRSTGNIANAIVGDFWLEYGAAPRDFAQFWNGGLPPDLTGIGAPQLHLGGTMLAADWNAGTNRGSGTVTVTSGTFTNA